MLGLITSSSISIFGLRSAREVIRNLLWFLTILMVMLFCIFHLCIIHYGRGRENFPFFFVDDILTLDKHHGGIRSEFELHHICILHIKERIRGSNGFNGPIKAHNARWFTGILCNYFLRYTLNIYTMRVILYSQQLGLFPIETNAPSPCMSFQFTIIISKGTRRDFNFRA